MSIVFQPDTEARLMAAARARGKTPDEVVASLLNVLPADAGEGEMLHEIGTGLPQKFWARYRTLIARREAQTLTSSEQAELIALSDKAEEATMRRIRVLVELAGRRGIALDTLMIQMGIRPVSVAS